MLLNAADKKVVRAIYDKMLSRGIFCDIDYGGLTGNKIRFRRGKSKKEIMYIEFLRDDFYRINFRIFHLQKYQDKLGMLTPHFQELLISGKDCRDCRCTKGGISFSLNNTEYKKCNIICQGFVFCRLNTEDIASMLKLIDLEFDEYNTNHSLKPY
jgi:hypothetical protein